MTSDYTNSHSLGVDWDDLRTFLAIARFRTLTAAAKALGVTQPTMGRRLAALEDRVGARLLVKMPGGYAITPLGDMILANIEKIEREVEATSRIISGKDVSVKGLVRLTATGPMTQDIVTPALARLQQRYPEISFDIALDSRNLSLSRREADLAIRVGRFDGKDIHARPLGKVAFGIYGTPDWADRMATGDVQVIQLLDDQMHLPESRWIRDLFPGATHALRTNSRAVIHRAAQEGIGLAALVRYKADTLPEVTRYFRDVPQLKREIWLGVHNDMKHVPRLKLVMDAISEAFHEMAGILDPDV